MTCLEQQTMNTILRYALFGLILFGHAAIAHGMECRDVSFPAVMQSSEGALKLNGLGLRQATFLKVDVYVAALYLKETSADANAILEANSPKHLILHFVRDVGRSDLNEAWDEGFAKNAKPELPQLEDRISAFKALMQDVKTGQRLALVYSPGSGVQVELDGSVTGTIPGDDFARALFAIWLGPHPPNAGLKAGLLGGKCD
jgi:hypothetical protein